VEIINIIRQIAEGMNRAHENGIIHRDLKPANIIITSDGTVKIVDFGLAVSSGATRLTKSGASVGTLAYMSPEQVGGEEITAATDIWALGVMIYEMMEGVSPFESEHQAGIVYGIAHRNPDPPILRNEEGSEHFLKTGLQTLCGNSLAKDPAERYGGLTEFLQDLRALETKTLELSGGAFARPAARARRRTFMAMAAVLALVSIWFWWNGSDRRGKEAPSIAVLPLQNISGEESQDFYAKGITGELIVGLGRFQGMRVLSRTSVLQFQGSDKPLPEIAAELGADLILEGTIMRVENQVKITAQLIDASSDELLWADSYSRSTEDVLILQSEIAEVIAREVLREISPEEENLLATARKIDPQVYEFYLRGKQMVEDMSFRQAREYFERAIAVDESFAPAYAGLSGALQLMGQWGWEAPETVYPPAREAATRAKELGGNLPEVHTALATIAYMQDWDWSLADLEFRKAVAATPGGNQPFGAYCLYLLYCQRFEECFTMAQRNIDLDPLNRYNHLILGFCLFFAGEWERAEDHFETMIKRWPDYDWPRKELAWTYTQTGRGALAMPIFEQYSGGLRLDPWIMGAYVDAGRMDEVREFLAEQKSKFLEDGRLERVVGVVIGHQLVGDRDSLVVWQGRMEEVIGEIPHGDIAYDMAAHYSRNGHPQDALRWLEVACDLRAPKMTSLLIDWELDPLRSFPDFDTLVERVGFPTSQ
jgi:TolB-like protein/Tfp pilus assembly protein PilF